VRRRDRLFAAESLALGAEVRGKGRIAAYGWEICGRHVEALSVIAAHSRPDAYQQPARQTRSKMGGRSIYIADGDGTCSIRVIESASRFKEA